MAGKQVSTEDEGSMRAQLTDGQISEVIASLQTTGQKVTGTAVRAELRRRFGTPGGVTRIYRLLVATRAADQDQASNQLSLEIYQLREQLAVALKRAEMAEHREQVHQQKWAMEIDSLRQQLRSAQADARKLSEAQMQILNLRRELHRLSSQSE